MKINNKGFSMIELLLTITILGILMGVGMEAFSRYQKKARVQAVDTMAKSATQAAEEYLMDHPNAKKVTFEQLYDGNYINNITDPYGNGNCAGRIKITKEKQESSKKLSSNKYQVSLCCSNDYYTYTYPPGSKELDPECRGIPYDIKKIKEVKVLHVYPAYSTNLQTWMNNYGAGIIKVTPVSIENFNSSPSTYLGTSGNWKYHVVVFGFSDCNSNKDLSASAASLVSKYLDEQGSVIFGHDTLLLSGCGGHPNFNSLAGYLNMELGATGSWSDYASTRLRFKKSGVYTEHPYKIGTINSTINIKITHVSGQIAHGDVWIVLDGVSDPVKNIYLSTYDNSAFIQTGHTSGYATDEEQKLLANIMFYMYAKKYEDD